MCARFYRLSFVVFVFVSCTEGSSREEGESNRSDAEAETKTDLLQNIDKKDSGDDSRSIDNEQVETLVDSGSLNNFPTGYESIIIDALPIKRSCLDVPEEIALVINTTRFWRNFHRGDEIAIEDVTFEILIESIVYDSGYEEFIAPRTVSITIVNGDAVTVEDDRELQSEYILVHAGDTITVSLPAFPCEPGIYTERITFYEVEKGGLSSVDIASETQCFKVIGSEIEPISSTDFEYQAAK